MAIIGSGVERGGKDLSIKPPVAADGCELQLLWPLMFSMFSILGIVQSTIRDLDKWLILRIPGSVDIGPTDAREQTAGNLTIE